MTQIKCFLDRTMNTFLVFMYLSVVVVVLIGLAIPGAYAATDPQNVVFDCDSKEARTNPVVALACNIYHEARGEPEPGMWLVALATRNRVKGKLYPDTYHGVVYEERRDKRTKRMVAMFSWTNDKRHDRVYNAERWMLALVMASRIIAADEGLVAEIPDITYGCQWYHRTDIKPYWRNQYHKTVVIGDHQCYALNKKVYLREMARHLPSFDDVMKGKAYFGGK